MNPLVLRILSYAVVGTYTAALFVLMLYGLHRYWIVFLFWRYQKKEPRDNPPAQRPTLLEPRVTVQLPLFNERYVAERLIDAVCALDYPKDKLEIQILDDSTDDTIEIVRAKVSEKKKAGFNVVHVRRDTRAGFKAGALNNGLAAAKGEFLAIFDADFVPPYDFISRTLPHFADPRIGMVQTRWGHLNAGYSLLTRLQALFLDGHFMLEHTARYKSGAFFNFNGTAGIWRKEAIVSAGGWSARTLTEDLDLSYRAQLAGWRFVFDPDFVCPAELPVDIHAFRSQQKRWTKGALQVARCLLRDLWRAPLSLHTKIEATVHLTANIGYLFTVIVAVLLLPSLFLRANVRWMGTEYIEALVFVSTTISVAFFYIFSQKKIYADWKWRVKDIPVLMSFGIGMCVSNAVAVWEGLRGQASDFVRTPKYNIQSKKDLWASKGYSIANRSDWVLQALFAVYSAVTFVIAIHTSYWVALPFIALFVFGFSYIAGLSLLHRSSG